MIKLLKKYKYMIIAAVVTVAILTVAFFSGGNLPKTSETQNSTIAPTSATLDSISVTTDVEEYSNAQANTESSTAGSTVVQQLIEHPTQSVTTSVTSKTDTVQHNTTPTAMTRPAQNTSEAKQDKFKTDPVPEGKPKPVEPQEQVVEDKKITCTISISCADILDKKESVSNDILELVPEDGWILKPITVEINEGESAFDVTKRICKDNKIHMEFTFTPAYNSSYIEGIGNIYEFDCGDNSGWIFKVNGWSPNYGCSRYSLKNGDVIQWEYSCNKSDIV